MGLLSGKRLLITGVISPKSIAFGIAKACRREGAELAFTYAGEKFGARVAEVVAGLGEPPLHECDVTDDAQIERLFAALAQRWPQGFDGFVHAIAFAPREAIGGDFLDGLTRDNFRIACDVSAYSFPALAKAALPQLRSGAALLTLSYLGAERAMPHYNTMGVAKAALEAATRYLAASLGPRGMRANAISAGPIRTFSSMVIKGFPQVQQAVEQVAPLRRNVTADEIGNLAAFLLSDLASGMTGEVVMADGGFSRVAAAGANDDSR